ncbi:MAG: hypothetical protein U0R19_36485 [Bryobacteraceae bacterium]
MIVENSDLGENLDPNPFTVYWGDGTFSRGTTAAEAIADAVVSHTYQSAGRYQIIAFTENGSGLRASWVTTIAVAGSATFSPSVKPLLSKVDLTSVRLSAKALGGGQDAFIEVTQTDPEGDESVCSRSKRMPVAPNRQTEFGPLVADACTLTDKVEIRLTPKWFPPALSWAEDVPYLSEVIHAALLSDRKTL